MKVHPVFHVSLLKGYQGEAPCTPPILVDGEEEFEVERILNHRKRARKWEYLVKWKGYGAHENSWEPESHMEHSEELLKSYKAAHAMNFLYLF